MSQSNKQASAAQYLTETLLASVSTIALVPRSLVTSACGIPAAGSTPVMSRQSPQFCLWLSVPLQPLGRLLRPQTHGAEDRTEYSVGGMQLHTGKYPLSLRGHQQEALGGSAQ